MKQAAAVLMLWCALACGQKSAPGENPATFRVAGFLTNAVTGEPVRRASVTLQFLIGAQPAQALYHVIADAGGHFEIAGAAQGQYQLWAERRGYPRQSFGGAEGILVTEDRADIAFRMAPYAALTGKVVDESGDAISGAAIQLIRSELQNGRRELRPALGAVTDDRGEYRIAALTQGRYYVSAYARAQAASENTVYPRRFFPGAQDLTTASALDLEPGRNQHADFRLTPETAFHIRGQVDGWEELRGVAVALSPRNPAERFGGTSYPARVGAEGRFELSGVAAGQYVVSASGYEGTAMRTASQLVAVGASDVNGVLLRPQPGSKITGQLTVETKQGMTVPAVTVRLVPDDFVTQPVHMAQFSGTRAFQFAQVMAGVYSLRISVAEPFYVKSASVGGMDALSSPVTVTESGGTAPINIEIAANGGEVGGTVKVQDRAAAQCIVLLTRRDGMSPSQDRFAQTDQNGKFLIQSIAPDDYNLFAFRDLSNVEYRNPLAMIQYSGATVKVTEGARQAIDLKLNEN